VASRSSICANYLPISRRLSLVYGLVWRTCVLRLHRQCRMVRRSKIDSCLVSTPKKSPQFLPRRSIPSCARHGRAMVQPQCRKMGGRRNGIGEVGQIGMSRAGVCIIFTSRDHRLRPRLYSRTLRKQLHQAGLNHRRTRHCLKVMILGLSPVRSMRSRRLECLA